MSTFEVLGSFLVLALVARQVLKKRQNIPLPPGPPADPLIGHLRILPDFDTLAEVLHEWSRKYGDVFSLRVPGKTIVVLNSEKAASDLLEKRSAIYSDRVRMGYYDNIGWGDATVFVSYGPFLSQQRKLYVEAFGKNVVSEYQSVQEREANTMLRGFLDSPKDFERHIQRYAGGIVTDIGYGHHIASFNDEFFDVGERMVKTIGMATTPIARLPSWFPGAWFVKFIEETKPFMDVQMVAGTARPSFTAKYIEAMYGKPHNAEQERALRLAAAMIYAGEVETERTLHAVTIFIAAMLLHPEVQQKAQEEIDRVVGRDRLPDLNDRDSLPYLQCVINETSRWHPVVPFGIPHQSTADDVYNGMFIPKGSIILANSRSMTWDEKNYHEPHKLKPERFLPKPEGAGEVYSANTVFGWGRRICAGRYLAENNVWMAAARILAVYTISPVKDAEGRATMPDIKFRTSTVRHPEPFPCDIQPRDEKARNLTLFSSQD
ncbi:cytochrome P450 [Irpex lacteus]|nr:cytochrome P450 [Irpex lacteus]